MKRQIQIMIVFGMMIGAAIVLTSPAISQSTTDESPDNPVDSAVQIISPEKYEPPDRDWIIVNTEFYSYTDSATGLTIEVETVWRRESSGDSALRGEITDCDPFQPLVDEEKGIQKDFPDCSSEGNQSISRTVRAKKSPTDYLEMRHKSYATQYCPDSVGCGYFTTFFDMYRTEASWYRTNTRWTAKQAKYAWGCPDTRCNKCVGQYFGGMRFGTFADVVAWYNDTQSWVYYVTYSGFPEMTLAIDVGTDETYPKSEATSKAYYSGSLLKSLQISIYWTD